MAEGGSGQDTERKRLNKGHSRTGDDKGRDKAGYSKKPVRNRKIRDKEGKSDRKLVIICFQLQVVI